MLINKCKEYGIYRQIPLFYLSLVNKPKSANAQILNKMRHNIYCFTVEQGVACSYTMMLLSNILAGDIALLNFYFEGMFLFLYIKKTQQTYKTIKNLTLICGGLPQNNCRDSRGRS